MTIISKTVCVLFLNLFLLTACLAQDQKEVTYQKIYQNFTSKYISDDGRVIDLSDSRKITTSEGQSYALFFALVNNDQANFAKILKWTVNNLSQGDLTQHLPAWVWGEDPTTHEWKILDTNSASDADLWIAYSLLEAGRLWKNADYKAQGLALLKQIEHKEVRAVDGIGQLVIPGEVGFVHAKSWKINPSYSPLQLTAYFAQYSDIWAEIHKNTANMLAQTASQGYSPDWATYTTQWNLDEQSSYDAIRVYMWIGMLNDADIYKKQLKATFKPFELQIQQAGQPPRSFNFKNKTLDIQGPIGFSAAALPFLNQQEEQEKQFKLIVSQYDENDSYYNNVLILFGLGWYANLYTFDLNGNLKTKWR